MVDCESVLQILVIHGGLFHRTNVTIEDLEAVERTEYVVPSSREDECPVSLPGSFAPSQQ